MNYYQPIFNIMKRALSFSFTLLVFFAVNTNSAQAVYYWVTDWNPQTLGNFIELTEYLSEDTSMIIDSSEWELVHKAKNSDECESVYDELVADLSYLQGTAASWELETERREMFEDGLDSIEKCFLDIQKEAEEAEAKRVADLRAAEVAQAIEDCDFDVIATFTTDEKMQTYEGRMACEATANEPEPTPVPEPVVVEPVVVPEPVITEPVVTQYVSPPTPAQVIEVAEEEPEPVQAEEIITTTSEEKIEVTQEELDRMVEERMNEKFNEPEPTPEPSFFKKVFNFLFGWMF